MHVDLYNGRKMVVVVVVLVLALYYEWRFCMLACLSLTTPNIRKTTFPKFVKFPVHLAVARSF